MDLRRGPPYLPCVPTPFVKMQGAGNDFVILDARTAPVPLAGETIRRLCDRRLGIGCDQLFRLEPSERADLAIRIWNADGSESGACGNGTRCVAALTGATRIETRAGILEVAGGGGEPMVVMGRPRFAWEEVPLAYAMDTADMPVAWGELARPMALSMGNPHLVFFVTDVEGVPLAELGPRIESDPLFPERVNVEVVEVRARNRLRARVWERGAGLTPACGSGACAAFAAARRKRLVDGEAEVDMPGGTLRVAEASDGRILLGGPVALVFRGEIEL